jgi:hypothetical protein
MRIWRELYFAWPPQIFGQSSVPCEGSTLVLGLKYCATAILAGYQLNSSVWVGRRGRSKLRVDMKTPNTLAVLSALLVGVAAATR